MALQPDGTLAGDYLITFDPASMRRTLRFGRWLARVFLPWARGNQGQGVGIPYVDYHRGDGVAVGPGTEHPWTPVLVGDRTPWVRDYRGLWGNDTADPLGGERGPAGPRYERTTDVRASWGNPVGWAGLDKVPPTPAVAEQLVEARIEHLAAEAEVLSSSLADQRARLRADHLAGVPVSQAEEAEARATGSRLTEVEDERLALTARRGLPPAPAGPHDHLHHRALPIPPVTRSRRRVLAVWAAVSTPLLLLIGALFLLPAGPSVLALVVFGAIVLLALEALAHRQFLRFLLILFVFNLVLSVVVVFWQLFLVEWRWAVAAMLLLTALVFLVVNLLELTRD